MSLRVLLADDHDLVREGFRAILERESFQVVAEATNGRDAISLADTHHPDLAVLDLSMPNLNGLDAGRAIVQRRGGRTRVVLLTMHTEDYQIVAALRAGLHGYIIKSQCTQDLVQALKDVAAGGTYLSPGNCRVVMETFFSGRPIASESLNAREREILQLIAEGRSTKEVANILGITVKSAESHRTRLMEKLDIHETATLVRYAIRHGLIDP
jgi:DNA-binding NarL/FixJ family response regulator